MNIPKRPSSASAKSCDALLPKKGENTAYDGATLTYTVDEAFETLGVGRFQYIVLALSGLCWISDSMEMLLLSFIKSPTQCEFNLTDMQAAFVTTAVGVGMLIGNLSWGVLADARGRRTAFVAATAFTLLCGLLSAAAPTYAALVVARGMTGIGIGGVPVAFSLTMEFLPMSSRGRWGMGLALFWSLGAILEATLAMVVMPHLGWRYLIALSSAPLALLLLLVPLVPESPRWLTAHGRFAEANDILRRVAHANKRQLPTGALSAPVASPPPPAMSRTQESGVCAQLAALVRPGVRAVSVKLWVIWFCAAFTYFGAVVLQPDLLSAEGAGRRCSYAHRQCSLSSAAPSCASQPQCAWDKTNCIPAGFLKSRQRAFGSVHLAENAACDVELTRADYASSLWSTSGEIPGTLVTLFAIDAIGRRGILAYLYAISAIAFTLLVTCPGRGAETLLFFVARAASNGYFQAIYLYTNEMFPADVRASAMGMSSAVARFGLILTPFVGQMLDNINFALAIAIYAGSCLVALLAVLALPIETTKRPLLASVDELQTVLRGKNVDDEMYASFKNDPASHPFVRALRLPARIDGRGARIVG